MLRNKNSFLRESKINWDKGMFKANTIISAANNGPYSSQQANPAERGRQRVEESEQH